MNLQKISLMDAYMIETLRSKGVTNQELIEAKDINAWNRLHESFDFQELLNLREKDPAAFETIIEDGYQVKFVTFNGLKNLLRLKFHKMEDVDYQSVERGIRGLSLNENDRNQLTSLLSNNWTVKEEVVDGKVVLDIELVKNNI
ncbi:hypothetical protein [Oceanobacillus halophilus]|uniref:Uncharacterized protein n=1 Tax=Oceanobacillus halophilus TaxID=930130 RepID=A0A494ZRR8_9BACI|nr:hypothetical protein [Oceanobacillus halophilus]RKQ27977.1 hypothetical protein D8M06_19405 [Oceanobacillus halophilus]